jgi:hypothetical protein
MTFSLLDKVFYIVFSYSYFDKKGMFLAPFWRNGIWTKDKRMFKIGCCQAYPWLEELEVIV